MAFSFKKIKDAYQFNYKTVFLKQFSKNNENY